MEQKDSFTLIRESIVEKSCLKQDIFALTREVFEELCSVLTELSGELSEFMREKDRRVEIALKTPAQYETEFFFGGDLLVFYMHTNVFTFPTTHMIHKNSYVRDEPKNAYVGVINIYNFLADSYRYNRLNDSGYLVGRIFLNRERHFFVEGKRQLGFLYNDFSSAVLDRAQLRGVVESAMLYALDFDLYTQPYNHVQEVTVSDLTELSQNQKLSTGKRLGFRFQADDDSVEF